MTLLKAKPKPGPIRSPGSLEGLKQVYELPKSNSDAEMAFYFDATVKATVAARYCALLIGSKIKILQPSYFSFPEFSLLKEDILD